MNDANRQWTVKPKGAASALEDGLNTFADTHDRLRVLTCGSPRSGKSSLIGRLMCDQRLAEGGALGAAAAPRGSGRTQVDADDIAWQRFTSPGRNFLIADTPDEAQASRDIVARASDADVAVVVVDACKGVVTETRRHSALLQLSGIRHVILAVNKMDLVDFARDRFAEIEADHRRLVTSLGLADIVAIPLAALSGDNVAEPGASMPWYAGPTLLAAIEDAQTAETPHERAFRMPVESVSANDAGNKHIHGALTSGSIAVGSEVVVLPSARTARVTGMRVGECEKEAATTGDAVILTLDGDLDISRGDVLAAPDDRPAISDQMAAHLVWMSDEDMLPGRPYLLQCGHQTSTASVSTLKHVLNVDNLDHMAGTSLARDEIGYANIATSRPVVFDPYETNPRSGCFSLIDKLSHETVAAGMIRFGLRRATNVHWQAIDIDKATRAEAKGQKPACLWFTGLSGSGKSTVANMLEKRLHAIGRHTYILDGDNVRHGLNRDLGFTDADRVENIRRVAETARLMVDAGLLVMVSFISPFRAERRLARELFEDGEFIEVFVDTPLEVCEARDPKGLYKRARAGQIGNFTGIDSDYEPPEGAEVRLPAAEEPADMLVDRVLKILEDRGLV